MQTCVNLSVNTVSDKATFFYKMDAESRIMFLCSIEPDIISKVMIL